MNLVVKVILIVLVLIVFGYLINKANSPSNLPEEQLNEPNTITTGDLEIAPITESTPLPVNTPYNEFREATASITPINTVKIVNGWDRRVTRWGNNSPSTDAETCRQRALDAGFNTFGFRNDTHPLQEFKNTCFMNDTTRPFGGYPDDTIHSTGCTDINRDITKDGC
jgi:hypothetical protein